MAKRQHGSTPCIPTTYQNNMIMPNEEDYDYAEIQDNEEPVSVECEVTITITRKCKLKVYDVNIYEGTDYNGTYTREIDFSDTDWNDVLEDNDIIPNRWNMIDCNVTPL